MVSRLPGKQRQGKAVRDRFLPQGQCHCHPISGLLFSKLKSSLPGSGFSLLSESFLFADGGLVIVILSEMEVREENNVEKSALRDGCAAFFFGKKADLWHDSKICPNGEQLNGILAAETRIYPASQISRYLSLPDITQQCGSCHTDSSVLWPYEVHTVSDRNTLLTLWKMGQKNHKWDLFSIKHICVFFTQPFFKFQSVAQGSFEER